MSPDGRARPVPEGFQTEALGGASVRHLRALLPQSARGVVTNCRVAGLSTPGDQDVEACDDTGIEEAGGRCGERAETDQAVEVGRLDHELANEVVEVLR